jgi:hypothetical protein
MREFKEKKEKPASPASTTTVPILVLAGAETADFDLK